MRVLHLIEGPISVGVGGARGACFGAMAACGRVARGGGEHEHRVVLIADRAGRDDAERAGLGVDRWVRAPLGLGGLAWGAARAERGWHADEVRVWSPGLRRLARAIGSGATRETEWSRPGAGGPGVPATEMSGPKQRIAALGDRAAIRGWWGAAEGVPVVALLADPAEHGDAREFAFAMGLIEVGIGPLIGVMSSGSAQLLRGRRFHRLTVRRSPLLVVRGSIVPWLAGADVAVLRGTRAAGSLAAARTALAAGLRVVGPRWLASEHPDLVGARVFATDGRTRSMLPALLRAIGAGGVAAAASDVDDATREVTEPAGAVQ